MKPSQTTILVIEDEDAIACFLRSYLQTQDFKFVHAHTAKRGLDLLRSVQPNLILLDLGLPDCDGLKVIQQIRTWSTIPIIILSARGQEMDKVRGLDYGADDYLTKPFGIAELMARIRVALRRPQHDVEEVPVFTAGKLQIDFTQHRLWLDNKLVQLTPIQFKLLSVLVRNAGKVITHQALLRAVWGLPSDSHVDYVRIYMHQLRHKLESDPTRPCYLHSEPGIGYRFWYEP